MPDAKRSQDLLQIIRYSIDSVSPSVILPGLLKKPTIPGVGEWLQSSERYLLTIGKASISSAEAILSNSQATGHFILAPKPSTNSSMNIHYGSHPVPDEDSLQSTAELVSWLREIPQTSHLLVVLSGGSSALLVSPITRVSLSAKQKVNELLIRSGASIHEINCVRKHLSRVKGGHLANIVPQNSTVLVISDVIGDDLSTIGSGPFYPDPTTFLEAENILRRYEIWDAVPAEIRTAIDSGESGNIPETPKPGTKTIPHTIIASNDLAREAAARKATELGYAVKTFSRPIQGLVEDVGPNLVSFLRQLMPNTAMIVGGEITVRVKGSGVGGRNQHLALIITEIIAGGDATFAAVGTDGIDGISPAAGAWTDGKTLSRAMRKGLDINLAIESFDSYNFFHTLEQTIETGPTGTNVMDLYLALT
ncbi:MAG: hydroxypyruvate reductase [Acidobacteria bacterium]|nr:MAG: hydroxypyruvate reductase [Acidobacteriota bacterium]